MIDPYLLQEARKAHRNRDYHSARELYQQIAYSYNDFTEKIDSSSASEAEKKQAKSLLSQFLKHPLVVSVLGSAIGTTINLL